MEQYSIRYKGTPWNNIGEHVTAIHREKSIRDRWGGGGSLNQKTTKKWVYFNTIFPYEVEALLILTGI